MKQYDELLKNSPGCLRYGGIVKEVVIISQARMTSSRLPGKVLMKIDDSISLLELHIMRLKRSKLVKDIIVATTVNQADDEIVLLAKKLGVKYYRGSELNVLERYYGASKVVDAEIFARVTSDCPFIDPEIIDESILQYKSSAADYGSNSEDFPNGMNVELFRRDMLKEAFENATKNYELEHVTPYFYTNKDKFSLMQVRSQRTYPKYRLTVDTSEDLNLVREVLKNLKNVDYYFTLSQICELLKSKPELIEINKNVRQKLYTD